mmetsp:Transcript_42276/g.120963  ORF Transcript_42276/g.120963 Transcript_42276/m.120963 type:complete len:84 (+) Transcript_42276:627-878(+)
MGVGTRMTWEGDAASERAQLCEQETKSLGEEQPEERPPSWKRLAAHPSAATPHLATGMPSASDPPPTHTSGTLRVGAAGRRRR